MTDTAATRTVARTLGRGETPTHGSEAQPQPDRRAAARRAFGADGFDLNLISLRHAHHARGSGYDRLLDYLPARAGGPVQPDGLWLRAFARALRPAVRYSGSTWYHRDCLLGEIAAARHWFRPRRQVFHFLYGENLFRYFGLLKHTARRHPIVCTYHTPPERFEQVVRSPMHLKRVDAVVVLTRSARAPFVELLGEDRVHFVPHGVDVEHFRPGPRRPKPTADELHCLCVGSHLRDYQTLARAAERLHAEEAGIRFTVITGRRHRAVLSGLPNVTVREGLDDEALLRAYQQTDAFVLPLRAATANNALLEALACGAPVVANSVEGISDYLSESCALRFATGDHGALAACLKRLRDSPELRERLARASRERALEFRWEAVAEQLAALYAGLLGGGVRDACAAGGRR